MDDLSTAGGGTLLLFVNLLLEHRTNVSSRAKATTGAGHDNHTGAIVFPEGRISVGEFVSHQICIGIQFLWTVEGDGGNVILHLDQDLFVVHKASICGR